MANKNSTKGSNRDSEEASEKTIEAYLVKQVKVAGGMCIKMSAMHHTGMPDRLCLFPGGGVFFAEIKGTAGRVSILQRLTLSRMKRLGFAAGVVRSKLSVDLLVTHGEAWKCVNDRAGLLRMISREE
jgi:hypothetical protein